MIAAWMFSSVVFTALLGVTAWCAEAALRAARRPTRAPWLFALAAGVSWPVIAPLARRFLPDSPAQPALATLRSIQVMPDDLPSTFAWTAQLDILLLLMWAIVSAVLVIRLARAHAHLSRIRRASEPRVIDGVPVLVNADVGPAVVGVVAPSVLLPVSMLDLAAPLRRLVLRHEEEHCRARDPWVVIGSAVALALVPWNVPLWWIVRRARLALEVDCDARVLATEGSSVQYAKLLLLISQRQSVTPFAPMLAAPRSHLERRLAAMRPISHTGRHTRFVIALAATIVAGAAACSSRIADVTAPRPMIAPEGPGVATQPYVESQVEKAAQQLPGMGRMRYPAALRRANVQGEVLAQFVVDANGAFEPGSFKVLESSHGDFTAEVERALPTLRFSAAEFGGVRVRQLVQQPFTFSLSVEPSPRRPAAVKPSIEAPSTSEARMIPGTGRLRYPDELRKADIQGEVVAQFVVDVNGEVVPGSFKVLRSDHPLFTRAVESSISTMRFQPAQVQGKKVRQLIQSPFTFSLSKY